MKGTALLPRSRMDGLVIQELDDETLVYDKERDEAHCLNQTAALVWEQCDGKTTVSQAAQSLQSKLAVPVGADIIWLAVKQLQRFHLVESTAKAPTVSRRTFSIEVRPSRAGSAGDHVHHRAYAGSKRKLRWTGRSLWGFEPAMLFGLQL